MFCKAIVQVGLDLRNLKKALCLKSFMNIIDVSVIEIKPTHVCEATMNIPALF